MMAGKSGRRRFAGSIAAVAATLLGAAGAQADTTINPNASPEAQALYGRIRSNTNTNHYFPGVHEEVQAQGGWVPKYANEMKSYSGYGPLIMELDLGPEDAIFVNNAWLNCPQTNINYAKKWAQAGGVVGLSWHESYPGTSHTWNNVVKAMDSATFHNMVWANRYSGNSVTDAMYTDWDWAIGYVTQLTSAHIPVIWRPFHEMNKGGFWWGNKSGADYIQLYKKMLAYFNSKGVNNLIWVWCPYMDDGQWGGNGAPYGGFYPGSASCDVVACDIYEGNKTLWGDLFPAAFYNDLGNATGWAKPLAIGETDHVPSEWLVRTGSGGTHDFEQGLGQKSWAYWVVWAYCLDQYAAWNRDGGYGNWWPLKSAMLSGYCAGKMSAIPAQ